MNLKTLARLAALALALMLPGCGNLESQVSAVAGKVSQAYQLLSSTAVKNQPPIEIDLWHGFDGAEKEALEELAEEFNDTVGKEQRIQLVLTGYAGEQGVSEAVLAAAQEEAETTDDLRRLPDLFFAMDDMAYRFDRMGLALHMDNFLTKSEQNAFLETVKAEAFPITGEAMTLFPVGIDTSVLVVNQVLWMDFCSSFGEKYPCDFSAFDTWESLSEAALDYQSWRLQPEEEASDGDKEASDEPDTEAPASTFFAAESWGRLMASGYRSLGGTMFTANTESVRFDFDRDRVRTFWDFWYTGALQGFFAGDDCLDAFATGEAVACLVPITHAADYSAGTILSTPAFADGVPAAMLETLGLVAVKGSREHEAAVQVFLRYLMEPQRMAELAVSGGRLPALKKSISDTVLTEAYRARGLSGGARRALNQAKEQLDTHVTFSLAVFDGAQTALDFMDRALSGTGATARCRYTALTGLGMDPQETLVALTGPRQYESWYTGFRDDMIDQVLLG